MPIESHFAPWRLALVLVVLGLALLSPSLAHAADAYEPNDVLEQAKPLSSGEVQYHLLEESTSADWIALEVREGMAYEVLIGPGPMWLPAAQYYVQADFFDSAGVPLEPTWLTPGFVHWSERGNIRMSFVAPSNHPVYARVRRSNPSGIKDYLILSNERVPNVVRGRVRSVAEGDGQPNWLVRLWSSSGGQPDSIAETTRTAADGSYRIATALDHRDCYLEFISPTEAEQSGWWGQELFPTFPGFYFNASGFQLPLRTPTTITADYDSYSYASIAGQVTFPESHDPTPLQIEIEMRNERFNRWNPVAILPTEADGHFKVHSLDPRARYRYRVVDQSKDLLDLNGWTEVTLAAGETLPTSPTVVLGGSVAGRITNTMNGTAVEGALIELFSSQNRSTSGRLATATTDSSGRYHIRGLRAGGYYLRITKQSPRFQDSWFDARREPDVPDLVEVRHGETTTADTTLHPDAVPPVTSAVNLSDFTSVVTASLVASDGPDGSGVAQTFYRVDSSTDQFRLYSGPVVITGFGAHTIEYYSVDSAGNAESVKSSTVWCWAGTRVSVTASQPRPAFGEFVTLKARLTDAYGWPIAGRRLRFERLSGGKWVHVATETTDGEGHAMTWAPNLSSKQTWRATLLNSAPWTASASQPLHIIPYAKLAGFTHPRVAYLKRPFSTHITLTPKHKSGTFPLVVRTQHYENGKWVSRGAWGAKAADLGDSSVCVARVSLSRKGRWRLFAVHGDSDHSTTKSGYHYITVK